MHRRLRIAFSQRMKLLQTDIDSCDATIRHLEACQTCEENKLCPLGNELYYSYRIAQARAKLLMEDTPYVVI